MRRFRLSPAAGVTPLDGGVILRTDLGTFQLHGADVRVFLDRILPLLDGTRAADAIADALPGYTRSSVISFLELLRQKGLIEPVPEAEAGATDEGGASAERWLPEERFFQSVGSADGYSRVRKARVLIAGAEPWGAVAAVELAAAGVGAIQLLDDRDVSAEDLLSVRHWTEADVGRLRRDAIGDALARLAPWCRVTAGPLEDSIATLEGEWDLLIAALTADDLYLLTKLARFAHQRGLRSIYGHLDGLEAWIGPSVAPGESACWNCARLRLLSNTEIPKPAHDIDAALIAGPARPRARSSLGPMGGQVGHLLAMESLKILGGFAEGDGPGRVFIQHLITNKTSRHKVIPMPWCDVCGGAAAGAGRGVAAGALDAARSPEELREVLEGFIDDRFGVVRTLTQTAGGLPFTLPLTAAATLAGYTEGTLQPYQLFQIGAGKGLTPVGASLSAVGEAIERYSAARHRADTLLRAPFAELGGRAVDPRKLCLYSEKQYQEPGFPFPRYSPRRPLHWAKGRWLDDGGEVLVPALLAYFNFQPAMEEYFCQVSSNGLAAGGDAEDAALRALFELVERDAFMLTWICQLPVRRVVLDAGLDPGLGEVIRQMTAQGIEVELFLIDAGVAIPTIVCLGAGDGIRWPGAFVSLATHANPQVAASKAILELAHVAPYLASIMRTHRIPATPDEVKTLEDHALYYVPRDRASAFHFMRTAAGAVPLSEIEAVPEPIAAHCCRLLERAGVRVAVVDVTSPDVALSPFRVARAVGTDMQPIHFGHRLQRLGNPRLQRLLGKRRPNPYPHPIA